MAQNPPDPSSEKALDLRSKYLGGDLVALLTAPTPEEFIGERPVRGGGRVPYVPGSRFIERANECFGFLWSSEVPEHFIDGDQVVAKVRVTVKIPKRKVVREDHDGRKETIEFEGIEVVKEQFGSSEIKRYARVSGNNKVGDIIDLGDDLKAAATDGMKKCLTQFGMFLDVYGKGALEEEGGVSKQQLQVVYIRGEKVGMDKEQLEKWAEAKLGKPLSNADPLEAMSLIPMLVDLAKAQKSG
jgi:hypothetical protein